MTTDEQIDDVLHLLTKDPARGREGEITEKLRELEDHFDKWWAALSREERAEVTVQKELLDQFGRPWRSRFQPLPKETWLSDEHG